ncbi:uncharacterized protein SCODWIG_02128 [Saccharomycodes ludwigii]|uniref:MYND-type domain-containing protein n=1 Tax=Saccharomycodes ludwigii TaxID=36035 RepID=A0A376B6N3_9ASCO|nr:uncharacterized protein SCODWIG_02128 [Saccharomycodes ludwigii]
MRESNHRFVLNNRAAVIINTSIYDRRALDTNSDIPLINSLNFLTYHASNSAKVREAMASDGAIGRLVNILNECYLPLNEFLYYNTSGNKTNVEMLEIKKRLSILTWKWTLAFQCLILAGTRGSEKVRLKLVEAGVIPILATILDNYLIFEKNFDNETDKTLDYSLLDIRMLNETFIGDINNWDNMKNYAYILDDTSYLESDSKKHISVEYLKADSFLLSDDFYSMFERNLNQEKIDLTKDKELFTDNKITNFPKPRDMIYGKIIPKVDDVIWSLQLLAFLSKYTLIKKSLLSTTLLDRLSFRTIINRSKQLSVSPHMLCKIPSDDDEFTQYDDLIYNKHPGDLFEEKDEFLNTFLSGDFFEDYNNGVKEQNLDGLKDHINPRRLQRLKNEYEVQKRYKQKWDPNILDRHVIENNNLLKNYNLNIFLLVEKYTCHRHNDKNIVYWSSVIMRNSCKKNEFSGVRQCANFNCGRWEQYPKQFAKCRRCKRTKYCSRDCQLKAWTYHRYWCQEAGCSHLYHVTNTDATTNANASIATTNSPTTPVVSVNIQNNNTNNGDNNTDNGDNNNTNNNNNNNNNNNGDSSNDNEEERLNNRPMGSGAIMDANTAEVAVTRPRARTGLNNNQNINAIEVRALMINNQLRHVNVENNEQQQPRNFIPISAAASANSASISYDNGNSNNNTGNSSHDNGSAVSTRSQQENTEGEFDEEDTDSAGSFNTQDVTVNVTDPNIQSTDNSSDSGNVVRRGEGATLIGPSS